MNGNGFMSLNRNTKKLIAPNGGIVTNKILIKVLNDCLFYVKESKE